MKKQLTGNDTNLISRVLHEIKIRDFIKEMRKDKELKENIKSLKVEKNKTVDTETQEEIGFMVGLLFVDLSFFISERLYIAEDSINELLMSVLGLNNIEIENITHDDKVTALIDVFKAAIPKTVMTSIEAMGLKKNIIQVELSQDN